MPSEKDRVFVGYYKFTLFFIEIGLEYPWLVIVHFFRRFLWVYIVVLIFWQYRCKVFFFFFLVLFFNVHLSWEQEVLLGEVFFATLVPLYVFTQSNIDVRIHRPNLIKISIIKSKTSTQDQNSDNFVIFLHSEAVNHILPYFCFNQSLKLWFPLGCRLVKRKLDQFAWYKMRHLMIDDYCETFCILLNNSFTSFAHS